MFWIKKRQPIINSNGSLVRNGQSSSVNQIIKPKSKKYKIILSAVAILVLGILVWVGVGAYAAVSKIITKNQGNAAPFLSFLGDVSANKLQGEGDGRINILLLGVGGAGHPGGQLADTIMVASIDPQNKKIALLSIPRDLYVKIDGNGMDKINAGHAYGENNKQKTGGGPEVMKKTVSTILDLPIHYYIRADFDGFTKLIDALGGITVNVEKPLSDPLYPAKNMIDYDPLYIKAGTQNFNGATALKFARSRETTSDFDRAHRQQLVLAAAKNKALTLGILANPQKISDIMKILGDHVRTDLQIGEMERLVSIMKDVDTTNMVTKVLDNSADGPLVSSNVCGGYCLVPKTGNYKEIQRIAHEIFSDPYLAKEKARLEVINATGSVGEAKTVQDMLVSYGYNVVKIDTGKEVSKSIIYDYSGGKNSYTVEFLKKRFNASVQNQPAKADNIDLTLVLGKDYLNQ